MKKVNPSNNPSPSLVSLDGEEISTAIVIEKREPHPQKLYDMWIISDKDKSNGIMNFFKKSNPSDCAAKADGTPLLSMHNGEDNEKWNEASKKSAADDFLLTLSSSFIEQIRHAMFYNLEDQGYNMMSMDMAKLIDNYPLSEDIERKSSDIPTCAFFSIGENLHTLVSVVNYGESEIDFTINDSGLPCFVNGMDSQIITKGAMATLAKFRMPRSSIMFTFLKPGQCIKKLDTCGKKGDRCRMFIATYKVMIKKHHDEYIENTKEDSTKQKQDLKAGHKIMLLSQKIKEFFEMPGYIPKNKVIREIATDLLVADFPSEYIKELKNSIYRTYHDLPENLRNPSNLANISVELVDNKTKYKIVLDFVPK